MEEEVAKEVIDEIATEELAEGAVEPQQQESQLETEIERPPVDSLENVEEEVVMCFMLDKKPDEKKLPCCLLSPNDSVDPSYTHLVLPYRVICRQRYRRAGIKQRAQFAKEVKLHEMLQTNALDGVRVHREFCNPIVRPPEPREIIKLTEKQKRRLEEILQSNYY